jgi:hypothetical protein
MKITGTYSAVPNSSSIEDAQGNKLVASRRDIRDPFFRENVAVTGDIKIPRGEAIEVLKYFNAHPKERTVKFNDLYYSLVKNENGDRYLAVSGKQWGGILLFHSEVLGTIPLTNDLYGGLDKHP